MTDALANLTAFERDMLWILANDGEQPGVEIRNTLMEYYEQPVNHGQLYPNLDSLVDDGLVNKGEIDGRTNSYSLTEKGRRALSQRRAWEAAGADDDVDTLLTDGGERKATVVHDTGNAATPDETAWKNGEYEYVVLSYDGTEPRLYTPDGDLIAEGNAVVDFHVDGEVRTSYGERHVDDGGDA